MKFLRKHTNGLLARTGQRMQKQVYDHVLREKERERDALSTLVGYIPLNPARGELCQQPADCPYTGCVLHGYPELCVWDEDFWERFWRIYEFLLERTA